MKRFGVVVLAFLLATLTLETTGSAVHAPSKTHANAAHASNKTHVHAAHGFGGTYKYGSDPRETVAVTTAKDTPSISGAGRWIMVIHGGGWIVGEPSEVLSAVNALSAGGYTVFNIDYRLARMDTWPDQWADVASAWSWIRSHASQFGIDPDRGATWGVSSGGQLAAMAGNRLPHVRAVVSLVGVLQPFRLAKDVLSGHVMSDAEFRLYTSAAIALRITYAPAFPNADAAWHSFYPQHYLSAGDAPTIMFQGTADPLVPKETAPSYAKLLAARHIPSKIVTAPGVGHSLATALDGGARQKAMFAWLNKYTAAK